MGSLSLDRSRRAAETEHLRGNLEEVIRGGAHGIHLNLSEISFLSSAGVGLLVNFHTQLKGIGGSFVITSPSERVKQVLDLCRLSTILLAQTTPVAPPSVHKTEVRRLSSPAGSFEIMECSPGKPLICERMGDPADQSILEVTSGPVEIDVSDGAYATSEGQDSATVLAAAELMDAPPSPAAEASAATAAPETPEAPAAPDAPVGPRAPVGPVAPVAPVKPVGPGAPVGPVGPTAPVNPGAPEKTTSSVAGWLVAVLSLLSRTTVVPPLAARKKRRFPVRKNCVHNPQIGSSSSLL
jgi:anti-anti-sigma factor